ncbi:hypothetical protein BH09GEM1_BH09GEM1_44020 [soil metagenome]
MAKAQVKRPRPAEAQAIRSTATSGAGSLPAIGLEAEFTTVVDGVAQKPEDVFGSPRNIVRGPLVHRTGRSYHLPMGGALYFDTGVIEIATPMIEIARGCGARGTRSLWESLGFLRTELDAWELEHGRTVRLVGFSAHYNVSFDVPASERKHGRSVEQLAYLLTYILAAPVMLLATNRMSSGVGVRPRGNRIEITADFTPDAALMAATATLIVGIVREVMTWPSYSLAELAVRGIPVFAHFVPAPHSSRKGWSARTDCFPVNPFGVDVNEHKWELQSGGTASLREMAGRTTRLFWDSIRALGDPLSLQLIAAVMRGRAPSLLELDGRPEAYDDVGRLCTWDDLFPITLLSRSRYERVLGHAIAGRRVRIGGAWHKPVGVRGWTHVVFKRERDGARRVRSLDDMLMHLDAWDRSANRRTRERRVTPSVAPHPDRRAEERRVDEADTLERRRESDNPQELAMAIPLVNDSDATLGTKPSPAARARTESPLVIVTRI